MPEPTENPTAVVDVATAALVVGATLPALRAADTLARRGVDVTLALPGERLLDDTTAAIAAFLEHISQADRRNELPLPPRLGSDLRDLIEAINASERITVLTNTRPVKTTGQIGNFSVILQGPDARHSVEVGAVILAPQALKPAPTALPGIEPTSMVTNLPGLLLNVQKGYIPGEVAILLDRFAQQGRLTHAAVLTAARYLAMRGSRRIRIYCQHVRVSTLALEPLYRSARSAGVEFCRCDSEPAFAEQDGRIAVTATDHELGQTLDARFDLVVNGDLLNDDNYAAMLETFHCRPDARSVSNIWLQPCQSSRPGIFTIGTEGTNADLNDLYNQAELAGQLAADLLSEPHRTIPDDGATVDAEKCVACLTCVRLCPHSAIAFDDADEAARVNPAACQRCGICVTECPADAIALPASRDETLAAAVAAGPAVTAFVCTNSAAQAVEQVRATLPDSVRFVDVPCAGRVDPRTVLDALNNGSSRVVILSCNRDSCLYLDGPARMENRMTRLKAMLARAGVDDSRIAFGSLIAAETDRLVELLDATPQPRK